ncbi:MAG TPA: serine/threonine-protein kinase [Candidatus Polarisedimenticolaceae bacterium]|nr:serine/threonine-protein kinase [Candidatus Polarisedimenticolaceae bacterium]
MAVSTTCSHCGAPLSAGSRFCNVCGQPVSPSSALPTMNVPASRGRPGEARFLPGAILAGRYRVVGLLGRGGMGEVYRADDLKLGQSVALKFLPPEFEADADRLQRFLDEVRTARQVSHTNVCRIYDAGEADGHHFLSMEYVDGEDLASLLRRIGHIPKDKAIQIARQLCAGLAASHETGVLHRDLKPANIMIDGKGRARITDFGLAAFAAEIEGAEIRSGTPAYMAPEQLEGREVTARSDLYALGLVLYELFTGKAAFAGRRDHTATPSTPSSVMDGFDPAVERVILRCLETDPARRPSSALAVAAALPGGDPLAAALAAGETPSPEMVAEAGENVVVAPRLLWGALGVFVASVIAMILLSSRTSLVGLTPLEKPPEVLRERAREILKTAGHDAMPADSLFMFQENQPYLDNVLGHAQPGAARWDVLRSAPPSGIHFWYRESPRPIVLRNFGSIGDWMNDPPETAPGMARVELDPDGRLLSLLIVPGEKTLVATAAPEPDWSPLLHATGVDLGKLVTVDSEWAPPVFADRRMAWTGSWPERPELPIRIEAASAGGRPVSLRVVAPWTRPAEESAPREDVYSRWLSGIVYVGVIVAAAFVALRNVRRGRGDRRGALRFALYLGAVRMLWFLGAHHVASAAEADLFGAHLAYSLQRVGVAYVFYLAIEPYARRLWPHMLVSWVRMLDGKFRDPLVGRDLLLGAACGAAVRLIADLGAWVPSMLGGGSAVPSSGADPTWAFEGMRGAMHALVSILGIHTQHLFEIIYPLTLILVFRLLLRSDRWAVIVVSIIGTGIFLPETGSLPGYIVATAIILFIEWSLLFRAGLLAFATMLTGANLIGTLPVTLGAPGWYAGAMLLSLSAIVAPAVWGFWTAQGGRPLFGDELERGPAR